MLAFPRPMTEGASDAERELAMRRKELEREFQDKMRELKAQEKRRMDRLAEDRLAWEEYKRTQQKEIADRAETVRRRQEVTQHESEELKALRSELEALRMPHAEEVEAARAAAAAEKSKLAPALKSTLKGSQDLLFWSSALSLAGGVVWLYIGLVRGWSATGAFGATFLGLAVL